jgi:hypothetical protein
VIYVLSLHFLFLSGDLSTIYKIQILVTHSVNFKGFSFSSDCILSITLTLTLCCSSYSQLSTYSDGFLELLVYPSSYFLCNPFMISKCIDIKFFVHSISTLVFVQHACLQSFDSTLDSPKKSFIKWFHCQRFFSNQYSYSENRTLNPGPKLLRVHILVPATYLPISNKGAWWRQGKKNYYTAREYAVGWGSLSTELMFTICRVQTWDIDLNRQRTGGRDQRYAQLNISSHRCGLVAIIQL